MKNYNSLLTLQKLVFDKIEFDRKGFKNKNELTFELQVQIGIGEDSVHRVTLVLKGAADAEYGRIAQYPDRYCAGAADFRVCVHTFQHHPDRLLHRNHGFGEGEAEAQYEGQNPGQADPYFLLDFRRE